ncbi:MAG: DUF4143 domain-containing protein [Crocinitomicaceae bacterium]|nr:DUF4143 domain-containing protein [Crocinitomicaceae bacterium]
MKIFSSKSDQDWEDEYDAKMDKKYKKNTRNFSTKITGKPTAQPNIYIIPRERGGPSYKDVKLQKDKAEDIQFCPVSKGYSMQDVSSFTLGPVVGEGLCVVNSAFSKQICIKHIEGGGKVNTNRKNLWQKSRKPIQKIRLVSDRQMYVDGELVNIKTWLVRNRDLWFNEWNKWRKMVALYPIGNFHWGDDSEVVMYWYQGKLIEHLVGQELLATQTLTLKGLSFWIREKSQSSAELDFIYSFQGEVIPIEVKSGATGTLKSLQLYLENARINYAIRFYAGKIILDKHITQSGKTFYLLSLPYFLVSKIEDYILWLKAKITSEEENGSFSVQEKEVPYEKPKNRKKLIPVNEDVLTTKHFKILAYCLESPKKGKEILEECLHVSNQSRNNKVFLKPLLNLGLLTYSDMSFLKNKEQRYVITNEGVEFLKHQKN